MVENEALRPIRAMRNGYFPPPLVEERRKLAGNALTAYDSAKAGVAVPGAEVRAFAFADGGGLLPPSCWHLMRLHETIPGHSDTIVGTFDGQLVISAQFLRINRFRIGLSKERPEGV